MNRKISNDRGFTLIELMAVIVILGIAVTIAATTGLKGGVDFAALNAETSRLTSDLRLLQAKATAQNDGDLSFTIISKTEYKIDVDTIPLEGGVEISATQPGFSFKPDGTKREPGTYEIKLTVGGETKTVEVSETGLVEQKN